MNDAEVRWSIRLAQVLLARGSPRPAHRALRYAAGLAAGGGLLRCFVDAGAEIHAACRSLFTPGSPDATTADAHGKRIVAALPEPVSAFIEPPAESPLPGSLTAREREVLSLLAAGLGNGAIALRLGTTEGTIKWYLQQIYGKLGVHRRVPALLEARRRGLLA
jgi:LuxR family maltose regulon positive regulatory protein